MMVRPTPASTQMIQKQVNIKEEPEISPPKRDLKCSFCGEEKHCYQACQVLKQMVIEQAEELTCQQVAEYEKSQEEAIRHTILEEYGPTILVSDPTSSWKSSSALLYPSEGGTRRVGLLGEGQTPEGPSWWSQLSNPQDSRPSQPQEEGTGDSRGTGCKSNQLPRYQTPVTMLTPYKTGGYLYQGSSLGPSGGPPGGGGRPPGRGHVEVVEEKGMTQEEGMKRRMRIMLHPLPLEIRRRFPPEDWTNGSGE